MRIDIRQALEAKTVFQVLRLAGVGPCLWLGHVAAIRAYVAPQNLHSPLTALEFYWGIWMLAALGAGIGLLVWFTVAALQKDRT